MPPELQKAYYENDRAVMRAYGFDIKTMAEGGIIENVSEINRKTKLLNNKLLLM